MNTWCGIFLKIFALVFHYYLLCFFPAISQFQLPFTNSVKLFHSLIRPIILYNAENWTTLTLDQVHKYEDDPSSFLQFLTHSEPDRVFQKFLKYILGTNTSCTNVATLGETGEYPVILHAVISLVILA